MIDSGHAQKKSRGRFGENRQIGYCDNALCNAIRPAL